MLIARVMFVKTGLLIVSNPTQIAKALQCAEKYVKKTLYIQLLPALNIDVNKGSKNQPAYNSWPKHSKTLYGIYSMAANYCQNVDVRVLLSHLKYNTPDIKTKKPVDLVIFDKFYEQKEIDSFIRDRVSNVSNYNVVVLDGFIPERDSTETVMNEVVCDHAVLGGTFDRLHVAHKLLLSEALLRAKSKLTVGITEENMLHSKTLWELIEDIKIRVEKVQDFLTDICPEVEIDVVPIRDAFGPAIVDPTMDMIIVSSETIKGGEKINEIRKTKGLKKLELVPVELIDEPNPSPIEEVKISSSTTRIRLLGTLLKPVKPNKNIPLKPYVIGLTGGIASGKSSIAKRLSELGAFIVDCDKVAHQVYEPGKPCHAKIVTHFGRSVLSPSEEIDRKVLGGIVFKHPEELQALNSIVWPAIADEVQIIIKNSSKEVVVIEAAVLLQAQWEKYCHEVWTTIIPKEEAIKRLETRNKLTEEQALSRINSQPTNRTLVEASNVVLSSFWDYQYTKQQVDKAWELLLKRLNLNQAGEPAVKQ